MKTLLLACLSLFIVSCASTGGIPGSEPIVKKRAAFDFGCPAQYIQVVQLELLKYGASGCGKKANYKVKCKIGACVAEPAD